ncbi:hypothetical protein DYB32_002753 [Aphanomyces invadans]|uniref:Cytochrome P450 n=1 Tax=Aphanomyces invadans TaxID=157072 RepID=A0A3R6Z7B9_9STRA|nr:hypothetical protein DYB32_002753 [Aphanomyces invadans]
MPVHLHRVVVGVVDFFGSVEGLGRITLDEADQDGMCQFYVMGSRFISVLKAEHVRTVVNASSFRRRERFFDTFVEAVVGEKALIQVMGNEWKLHRKLVAKALGWQNLVSMAPVMASLSNEFATVLLATKGPSVDVAPLLKHLTLDIIGATSFGKSFGAIQKAECPVADAFKFLLNDLSRRRVQDPLSPASSFYWIPTAANKMYHRQSAILRATIDQVVASRLRPVHNADGTMPVHQDLLQYLVDAAKEEASGVTRQSFADNLLTFLFGGYDTTSTVLAYTLHLVAANPRVQENAILEIHQVLGLTDLPTYDSISKLTYCAAVITESLRLFPPVHVTMRTLETDLDVGGHHIPKDTNVLLPIYWIHRFEANWGPDADVFRPERHLGDGEDDHVQIHAKDKAFRMMAFSGGPRSCVGFRFAMMEAVIALVVILRRCKLSVPADAPSVRPVVAGIVTKPEHGVWLHVEPRDSST